MWRRALPSLVLWFVAGQAAGGEPWVEVRSPHFTVLSDAGEGAARRIAWQFEQVRAAFQKLWPWARLARGKPALVFAARDEARMKRLAPEFWERKGGLRPGSVSVEGADRQYLVLRVDVDDSDNVVVTPYFTLYRSYVAAALAASFDRDLPVWLARGLAEVFGNTHVREEQVLIGRPVPWHIERLRRGPRLPLRILFAVDRRSPYYTQDEKRDLFDAECWALGHYLAFGDDRAHAAKLNRFLVLWNEGRSSEAALAEAFPDLQAMEKGLNGYVDKQLFSYARLQIEVVIERERLPARALGPAEAAATQSALHVAMRRPTEAAALAQEARAADPKWPGIHDAEGLLFDASDDDARALEAYRKAAELGSTSFYTHYRIAQLTWKHDPDRETLQAIRRSLERAVELNDGYASAYSYLAEVTSDLGEPEKALSLARRALALEPGSSRHYVSLARVHWDLKQPDDARAAGQRSLALARTTGERSNAQAFLDFLTSASARAAEAARVELAAACWGGDGDACVQASPELERRCLQADARSCSGLAWIHRTGTGLPADPAKVATFRARGCDAGDKRACVEAAWSQARGEGVPKDEAKAWATLDGLCGEGVLHACTRLGLLHAYKGTRADLARAKQLLRKACAGDEGEACSALSTMPN